MKYAIKITGCRWQGEYDGADTVREARERALVDFVPFVPEHATVRIVSFSDDGMRVRTEEYVQEGRYT